MSSDTFTAAPAYGVAATGASGTVCYIDSFDVWIDSFPEDRSAKLKSILKLKELKGWSLPETKAKLETLPLLIEKETYAWAAKSLVTQLQELGFQARMENTASPEEIRAREKHAAEVAAARAWYQQLSQTEKNYVDLLTVGRPVAM